MKHTNTVLKSLIHASGVLIYVTLLAKFFMNAEKIFGKTDPPEILIIPFMLVLFIVSATTTSLLVLGKPLSLLIEGLKKEALILLISTIAWLVFFLIAIAGIILSLQ